jgi:hypothetical protein
MAYVGQTRSRVLIAQLAHLGIGECVVRGELPARRSQFFHDCGAYRDWRAGRAFDAVRWQRDMRWMSYRGIVPDFVVVPDVVAGGLASLTWSAFWRDVVPEGFPAYLAVQDGMSAKDVIPCLSDYQGIFVGTRYPGSWPPARPGSSWHTGRACGVTSAASGPRTACGGRARPAPTRSCLPLRHAEYLAEFLAALGPLASTSAMAVEAAA